MEFKRRSHKGRILCLLVGDGSAPPLGFVFTYCGDAEKRRKAMLFSWNLGNVNYSIQSVLILILEFFLFYITLRS